MAGWHSMRQTNGWRLERSVDGLARIVSPNNIAEPPTSIGKALAQFAQRIGPQKSQTAKSVLCVHGLMGERETFSALVKPFDAAGWRVDHFRYDPHARTLTTSAALLAAAIQAKRNAEALCIIGHSFGCRLIAAALSAVEATAADIVFIAPPISEIRWAKVGAALPPVRAFLGPCVEAMARQQLETRILEGRRVLVLEGRNVSGGDGWLRAEETALPSHHERAEINASHSGLLDAASSRSAINAFVGL